MLRNDLLDFYHGKTVLVTGHTGFKGSWLTRILLNAGANVVGYSLEPPTEPSLFQMAWLDRAADIVSGGSLTTILGDVRDLEHLKGVFEQYRPQIVIHLAAQPIVLDSYRDPVYTYETNVMGTVHVLECIRLTDSVRSAVMITTDKVYKNNEWEWGYREDEPLDGFDPYSNSKSCAELSVHCYKNSFFSQWNGQDGQRYLAVSTARAGNVIGGGDYANNRIIPDCVRALELAMRTNDAEAVIAVRNPYSTRPYQHVLEPLAMYLTIAKAQWSDLSKAAYYNVGPDDEDCVTTGDLVTMFCNQWNQEEVLPSIRWEDHADPDAPHEANFLKLDSTRIKMMLGYRPRWHIAACMEQTIRFTRAYLYEPDTIPQEMDQEIQEFFTSYC